MIEQLLIFCTAHSVSDPRGVKMFQRFPYTFRAFGFAAMTGTMYPMFVSKLKRFYMSRHRIAGFISGHIEGKYIRSFKLLNELHRLHTLLFGIMTKCTKNQPTFHTCHRLTLRKSSVNGFHHFHRCQSFFQVKQGGKTDLRINYIICFQLFKKIEGHQPQLFFCLHKFKALYRSCQIIHQVGAAHRRNKGMAIILVAHSRIDLLYYFIAETAIEVQVQFYFRQLMIIHTTFLESYFGVSGNTE